MRTNMNNKEKEYDKMFELTNLYDIRSYYIGARFTEKERDFIKKSAKRRKLTVSDLLRIAIKEELKNKK